MGLAESLGNDRRVVPATCLPSSTDISAYSKLETVSSHIGERKWPRTEGPNTPPSGFCERRDSFTRPFLGTSGGCPAERCVASNSVAVMPVTRASNEAGFQTLVIQRTIKSVVGEGSALVFTGGRQYVNRSAGSIVLHQCSTICRLSCLWKNAVSMHLK
jgi:hypothetical protein